MAYVNFTSQSRPMKLIEGWLEHKSAEDHGWKLYWCVLRGNIIFIFTSQDTSRDTHIGTLQIDGESKLVKREGDERGGYKFDLHSKGRLNKFKTKKFSERELWKAFVEGITTGHVSDNIDLLQDQIDHAQALITQMLHTTPSPQDPPLLPYPLSSKQSANVSLPSDGFESPDSSISSVTLQGMVPDRMKNVLEDRPAAAPHHSNQIPDVLKTVPELQNIVFFSDPSKRGIPSWFFGNCSRDLAKKILIAGAKYGNTLMRSKENAGFVISKLITSTSENEFLHFKVELLPRGYKVNVENPHEPMRSLEEVMEFFKRTSGSHRTFPMTCNDLETLGVVAPRDSDNDYTTRISMAIPASVCGQTSGTWNPSHLINQQILTSRAANFHTTNRSGRSGRTTIGDIRFNSMEVSDAPEVPAPAAPTHRDLHKTNHRSASVPDIPLRQCDLDSLRLQFDTVMQVPLDETSLAPSQGHLMETQTESIYVDTTKYLEPVINTGSSRPSSGTEVSSDLKLPENPPTPHKTLRVADVGFQTDKLAPKQPYVNISTTKSPQKRMKPPVHPRPPRKISTEYINTDLLPKIASTNNNGRPKSIAPPPLPPNHPPPLTTKNHLSSDDKQSTVSDDVTVTFTAPMVKQKSLPAFDADCLQKAMTTLKNTKSPLKENKEDKEPEGQNKAHDVEEDEDSDDVQGRGKAFKKKLEDMLMGTSSNTLQKTNRVALNLNTTSAPPVLPK